MRISTLAGVFLLGALAGCDNGGPGAVGAPCNTADDCQGSLICDVHNDQGSCQEPHGHGTEGGSESESTGHSHDTDHHHDTDHDHDTEHGETEHGDTEHGETEHGETEHDHTGGSSGSTGGTGGTTGGETTGADEVCAAFCGCMQTACASYDAYPYADEAACLAACDALDETTLQCFGGFCQQAMDAEGTLAEHYCEHAWGDLGNDKC